MLKCYLKSILLSIVWISQIYAFSGKILDKYTQLPVEGAVVYLQRNPFIYDSSDANGNFSIPSGSTRNINSIYYKKNGKNATIPAKVLMLNGRTIDNIGNVNAAHGLFILHTQENRHALFLQNKFVNNNVTYSISPPRKTAVSEINDTVIFRANKYATKKMILHNITDGIQVEMDTVSNALNFEISDIDVSTSIYQQQYCRDTVHLYANVLCSKKNDTTLCTVSISTTDPFTHIVNNQDKTYQSYRLQTIDFAVLFDKQMPPAHLVPFNVQFKTANQTILDTYYFLVNPFTTQDFSIVRELTTDSTIKPDGILNYGERFEIKTSLKNETDLPVQSLEIGIQSTMLYSSKSVSFGSFSGGQQKTADSTLTILTKGESTDSILKLNMFAQGKINNKSRTWLIPIEMKARLDLKPPVIDLKPGKHLQTETLGGFIDPGIIAIDAYDGDCSKRVTTVTDTFPNVLLIKYNVTDLANHASHRERTVAIGAVPIFDKYNLSTLPPLNDIQCKLTKLTVEGNGPNLSLINSIKINYSKSMKSLYEFSIECNSSPFYSSLVSNCEFYLNEPLPEAIIKKSGIPGLDGSYYLRIGTASSGNSLTLISKTGLFALTFEP